MHACIIPHSTKKKQQHVAVSSLPVKASHAMLLSHLYAFECVGIANARKPYTIRFNLSSRLIKSPFAWLKPTDVWAQCLPLTPVLHTEA